MPAKSQDPARSKVGSSEDIVSKGKPEDSSKERGATGSSPLGKEPVKRRLGSVPKNAAPAPAPEDDPDLHEYAPSEPGDYLPEHVRKEVYPSQEDVPDVSSLEPRRIASIAWTRGVKGLSTAQAYVGKTE